MKDLIMKWGLFIVLMLALPWPAMASSSARGQHYEAALVVRTASAKPGAQLPVAVVIRPDPDWHIYWKNPGETGYAPALNWSLPKGWLAGEVKHPTPLQMKLGGYSSNVHNGETVLRQDISVGHGFTAGSTHRLMLDLDLLVCSDTSCVPDPLRLEFAVPIGTGNPNPDATKLFQRAEAALPKRSEGPVGYSTDQEHVTLTFPGVSVAENAAAHVFFETPDVIYEAGTQAFETNAQGTVVTLEKGGTALTSGMRVVLSIWDQTGAVSALEYDTEEAATGSDGSSFLLAFIAALGGGLLLNLMPCVFPMISLKAMTIARAGDDERQVKIDALGYAGGAITTVMALGAGILLLRSGGSAVGWAFQLQDPRVMGLLLLLVVAIATNMAGLFELPSLQLGMGPSSSGIFGSFSTGALSAIIATPCTGPFMAGALGAALVLPAPAAMAIFMGLGLGLASPFLALAFFKPFRTWIPKPGNWMITLRQALSLPMFATAVGLLWIIGRQTGVTGMIASLACAMLLAIGLWWYGLRQHAGKSGRRSVVPVATAVACVMVFAPLNPDGDVAAATRLRSATSAEVFSPERLAALRKAQRPVLLYFTADWCLTCKVNEATSLSDAEVLRTFRNSRVSILKGDWTRQDKTITHFLQAQGRAGVPLYLWYGSDGRVKELPQILTPEMLKVLARSN